MGVTACDCGPLAAGLSDWIPACAGKTRGARNTVIPDLFRYPVEYDPPSTTVTFLLCLVFEVPDRRIERIAQDLIDIVAGE
jgi:hypothetical protein